MRIKVESTVLLKWSRNLNQKYEWFYNLFSRFFFILLSVLVVLWIRQRAGWNSWQLGVWSISSMAWKNILTALIQWAGQMVWLPEPSWSWSGIANEEPACSKSFQIYNFRFKTYCLFLFRVLLISFFYFMLFVSQSFNKITLPCC